MNSLYNKNITLFKERFPSLFEQYKTEIQNFSQKDTTFEITNARSGDITAIQNGLAIHSTYNPIRESQKLIDSSNLAEKEAAVFLSCGLGYTPIIFVDKYPKKTLIIIEPDFSHLFSALASIDWQSIFKHEKLIILFRVEPQDVIAILEHTGIDNCEFFHNSSQSAHCESYFSALLTLIDRNKQKDQINNATLKKFAQLWLRNTLHNSHFLLSKESVNKYRNTANHLSACVLAAGPNLNTIIPFLQQIKERCILICVDTALRACAQAGIQPHFIVVGDPQYWNSLHLEGLDFSESTLITEVAVYPSVFRFTCKEIVLFNSLYPPGIFLETHTKLDGKLGAGGSVAASAWDFARLLGCKNIYMAALDLGFPKKQTHFKGSTFEEKVHSLSHRLNSADQVNADVLFSAAPYYSLDYAENKILTDKRLSLYSWWFESKCAAFPQHKTFSLSENSLRIPGIRFFAIEDLCSQSSKTNDINCVLEKLRNIGTGLAEKSECSLYDVLASIQSDILSAKNIVTEAISLCTKAKSVLPENANHAINIARELSELYFKTIKKEPLIFEYAFLHSSCEFPKLDETSAIKENVSTFFDQAFLFFKKVSYFLEQCKKK